MADTTSRPGWYRDPGGEAEWRWWDGTAWTAATHTASGVSATAASGGARLRPSSTRSRSSQATALLASVGPQQWRAIAVLGALFVVAVAVVTSAIVLTGGPGNGPPDPAAGTTGGTLPAEAPPDTSEDVPTPQDDAATDDEAAPGDADGGEVADDGPSGTTRIDLDGVCTVEVDAEDLDDPVRPWHFDECTSAPIALDDEQRWIVVVASLSGDEHDETSARDRAADQGFAGNVLWSTHYPSLNPGLWVVYDGPFPDQDVAAAAAEEIGGGAYVRALADEDGDRYRPD